VDAAGFLLSGGYFVSFMSGNSTRAAVGLVGQAPAAALGFGLIAAFVAGVTAGALIGRRAGRRRPTVILAFVAMALAAAAAVLALTGAPWGLLLLAFAMGAENTVFAEDGEVRIGLTYMTGALVKLGKGLAAALHGRGPDAWAPYLVLWLGLALGAVAGAAAFARLGAGALWIAAGLMALFALAATNRTLTAPLDEA